MSKTSQETLDKYTIRSADFVSCNQAFIDCRTPGSDKKENYSMIGPGVTQSDEQFINVSEEHGFNIGAAAMPNECVNNLHIHFTAEVFFIHEGQWEFKWGNDGENTAVLGDGDILSPRTWLFRGFKNVGKDKGFLFTVLGGDDTGGIIWHPQVLKDAKDNGLVLTTENKVVDTVANPDIDADSLEQIQGITKDQMATLRQPNVDEMLKQAVLFKELDWKKGLLCSVLSGHECEIAPAIGWGITQERDHTPKIYNPHGFSVEWLKIPAGQSLPLHKIKERQVLKIHKGTVKVTLNEEQDVYSEVKNKDIVSVPANAWKTIENTSAEDAFVFVVSGGDSPNAIQWNDDIVKKARQAGYGVDHSGYVSLYDLVKYSMPALDGFVQC